MDRFQVVSGQFLDTVYKSAWFVWDWKTQKVVGYDHFYSKGEARRHAHFCKHHQWLIDKK